MATRNWNSVNTVDGGSYAFNPLTDVLNFNSVGYHASKVVLAEVGPDLTVNLQGKTITLLGMTIAKVAPANFTFNDHSIILAGTSAGNSLVGSAYGDQIHGLGAADTLDGGLGADYLYGGTGTDRLNGGDDADTLVGGDGADTIDGGEGADSMVGGQGSDAYTISELGDKVVEDSIVGSGVDTVTVLVNDDTLDANVESMVLGTGVLKGTGNSGDNTITGNGSNNNLVGGGGDDSLVGNAGADVLNGGSGNDTLAGGGGNDTYIINSAADSLAADPSGSDTVKITGAGFDYALGDELEKLDVSAVTGAHTYTGNNAANTMTGSAQADSMVGGDGDDSLLGYDGKDTLDGGTGADALRGGLGNDLYVIDNSGDSLNDTGGIDTVKVVGAGIDHTLDGDAERLDVSMVLGGGHTYTGNSKANLITDGAYSNTLTGGLGNDTIRGGGGSDVMYGGYGADLYVIEDGSAMIYNTDHLEAIDTVRILGNSISSYALAGTLSNLDMSASSYGGGLYLNGNAYGNVLTAGDYNDTIAGYGGDDSILGGGGNDFIIAQIGGDTGSEDDTLDGGAGDDTLDGGYGDDRYVVDSSADVIQYTNNLSFIDPGGTDTVVIVGSSISSYALGTGLDYIDALGSTHVGAMSFTGNAGANGIFGSHQDDSIDGIAGGDSLYGFSGNDSLLTAHPGQHYNDYLSGGTGADTLNAGYGHDTYVIDNAGDVIVTNASGGYGEMIGDGIDTVQIEGSAVFTYTLAAELENLMASQSTYGGTLLLNGNAVANSMVGGGNNDTIHGGGANDTISGGAGADYMDGDAGDDVFYLDNPGDWVYDDEGLHYIHLMAGAVTTWQISGNDHAIYGETASSYTLNGAANDNILSGGGGNDTLNGNAADDTLSGGYGDDLINGGAGLDSMIGGFGNDVFVDDFSYGGSFTIQGQQGTDTLRFQAGQDVVFTPFSASISGMERIDLFTDTLGNSITLGYGDVDSLSEADTLYIDGDASDTLDGGANAGTWTLAGTDITGTYNHYTLGGLHLYVDMDIVNNLEPA